jgi:hypothetical protein
MFNITRMVNIASAAISEFAIAHQHETFYAFAIDSNMLCLNSIEQFQKKLAQYKQNYPNSYSTDEDVNELRKNTGDWEYQGFFHMLEIHGFDDRLYDVHYEQAGESIDGRAPETEYAKAMVELVIQLLQNNAFRELNLSPDFNAALVDHNY